MPSAKPGQPTGAQIALLHTLVREGCLVHCATRTTELVHPNGRPYRSRVRLLQKSIQRLIDLGLLEKVPDPLTARVSWGSFWRVSPKGLALVERTLQVSA